MSSAATNPAPLGARGGPARSQSRSRSRSRSQSRSCALVSLIAPITVVVLAAHGCGDAHAAHRDAGDGCPRLVEVRETGTLADPAIDEASGLVASRRQSGVFYVHNDSGDAARFFAITAAGAELGEFALPAAANVDWEDLAIGPGPAGSPDALYLGDIGDNAESRADVRVYRVAEPTLAPVPAEPPAVPVPPVSASLEGVDTLVFTYPDGPHNAETLLVDPVSGSLYIVTKNASGPSAIYRADAPLLAGAPHVLALVGALAFAEGNTLATGGDVSPSGDFVAIRTYSHVHVYRREAGTPLEASFASGAPCTSVEHFAFIAEAIAWSATGRDLFAVSEGAGTAIDRLQMR